jgi:putative oxidoreductase
MKWKQRLADVGLLWLRVLMGLGIMTHGYPKVFGGRVQGLAKGVAEMGLPMPELMAWAAALSEFVGGLLVVIGLATRPAAFLILVTMTVAAFIAHGADPLSKKELALAYWTIAGTLVLTGAGPFALDHYVRWGKPAAKKE